MNLRNKAERSGPFPHRWKFPNKIAEVTPKVVKVSEEERHSQPGDLLVRQSGVLCIDPVAPRSVQSRGEVSELYMPNNLDSGLKTPFAA